MTNQELNKAVAEIIKQPGERWSERVRNWAEDLPACMRDLWPWLSMRVKGLWLRDMRHDNFHGNYEIGWEGRRRAEHGFEDEIYYAATLALAICHAVLAVEERDTDGMPLCCNRAEEEMKSTPKGASDDSKG